MYTQEDLNSAQKALLRACLIYTGVAALFILFVVLSCIFRWPVVLYAAGILLTVFSVFYFGMYISKIGHWYRFVRDLLTGLERETSGTIAEIDAEPSIRDGLEFLGLRLLTGEPKTDAAGGRILYYDTSKLPISFAVGDEVDVKLYGYYVKEMKAKG